MTRRYLANKYSPLSKFRSLALTLMVDKMFPQCSPMSCCFPQHSVLQMRKLKDKGWDSFYYTIIVLDGSKK